MKTEKILNIYSILNNAKYAKLNDEDKVKLWKIVRKFNPIATKFEEDVKDAQSRLKLSDDFDIKLQKARQYEQDKEKSEISELEYNEFLAEFNKYNKLVNEAIREFADKDNDIEFEKLSENALGKLMSSNEWTLNQVLVLNDIVE